MTEQQRKDAQFLAEAYERVFVNAPEERTAAPQSRAEPRQAQIYTPERKRAETPENASQSVSTNYVDYYDTCAFNAFNAEPAAFLQGYGINPRTMLKVKPFKIGFDPNADPINNPGGRESYTPHPAPRLIIPSDTAHYTSIRIDGMKEFERVHSAGERPGVTNAPTLYDSDAAQGGKVFVCADALQMLAVLQAGAPAISINGNPAAFLEMLERDQTSAHLILTFDTESRAGKRLQRETADGLKRLNVIYNNADFGEFATPLEALAANAETFSSMIGKELESDGGKPDNLSSYIDGEFAGDIATFMASGDIKSGFANLDEKQTALYPGLYCIAAISSLGKTTFITQMADNIAKSGKDVLIFSLEQSRLELTTKAIAREMFLRDPSSVVTSLNIRKGYIKAHAVQEAIAAYKAAVQDRISVIEGNFSCNVRYIERAARRYALANDATPVIIVDYLQIIQPGTDSSGRPLQGRDAIDDATTALKRLSRELDAVVIVISSVNRQNYLAPIDFESLKESGCIEYSCDVVWGLQLACVDDDVYRTLDKDKVAQRTRIKEEKSNNPREIDLVCLKNRYGISSYQCAFTYYPDVDTFEPDDERQKRLDANARKPKSRADRLKAREEKRAAKQPGTKGEKRPWER